MQDVVSREMTPVARVRAEDELLLDLFAEIAMRAWISAKPKAALTHRTLEHICDAVREDLAATESAQRTVIGMHDGAHADSIRRPCAHLLKCHNAIWRRIIAHEAATRVSKMKPDGYVFNAKKLPAATLIRSKHGALYSSFRAAAKSSHLLKY